MTFNIHKDTWVTDDSSRGEAKIQNKWVGTKWNTHTTQDRQRVDRPGEGCHKAEAWHKHQWMLKWSKVLDRPVDQRIQSDSRQGGQWQNLQSSSKCSFRQKHFLIRKPYFASQTTHNKNFILAYSWSYFNQATHWFTVKNHVLNYLPFLSIKQKLPAQ